MKVFLIAALFFCGGEIFAQNEVVVTPTKKDPVAQEDTIVKPTKAQLKTTPHKKVVTESDLNKPEETTGEQTHFDEKKQDVVTTETTLAKSNLYGFHADLNVPHILNYGVDFWNSSRTISVAASFGGYSQSGVGKSGTDTGFDLKISNYEMALRYHPFQSAFYMGAILGQHTLTVEKTATYTYLGQSRTTTITGKINASYVTPHIGWLWKADGGFTFGMDLGYLVPFGATKSIDEGSIKNDPLYGNISSQSDYIDNRKSLDDQADKYGKTGLPFIALLRFGWLF